MAIGGDGARKSWQSRWMTRASARPNLLSVVLVKVIIYVQKVKKKKQLNSKLWGQKFSSNNSFTDFYSTD